MEWEWGRMCLPYKICPGLAYHPRCCFFGRVSAFIPAIYLHSGPIAGGPVGMTIHGSGLTMTKKRTLFLLPKLWPSFNLPGSRCTSLRSFRVPDPFFMEEHSGSSLRVHRQKDPFLIPYVLGTFHPKSVFLGGLGVVGPFPSFVP